MTIEEALNHPFLANVRDESKEIVADGPIILDFEKEGELGKERLRELFIKEISYYNNK